MEKDPETTIKGVIAQTIVEEMFRELGFYVLRTGQENIVNPLTQLEQFIAKCGGKFSLKKGNKYEYTEADYFRKMPDFCVIDKDGKVSFIEVKYREHGMIGEEKLEVFDFYPETYMIIVNLEVGDDVVFRKKDSQIEKIETYDIESVRNSRFYLLICDEDEEDEDKDILSVLPLSDWLKEEFKIEAPEVIKKYEKYVVKWLRKTEKKIEQTSETKKELLDGHFRDEVIRMRRAYELHSYYLKNRGFPLPSTTIIKSDIHYDDNLVAFLVHVRILYRFFNNLTQETIEAQVEDYIPGWKIKESWDEMKHWYNQINSHLSHLDYSRTQERGFSHFPIDLIYSYFIRLIIDFLNELPNDYKTPLLEKLLKDLKQEGKNEEKYFN